MLIPLEQKRRSLAATTHTFTGGETRYVAAPPGEGGFRFDQLTVGFVLSPQRNHEARYGTDRVARMPLDAGMGWVLPAGVDGWCSWDAETAFLNVALGNDVFARTGLDPGRLRIGTQVMDPMLVQMAIVLHEHGAAGDTVGALYRETVTLAMAAHLAESFGKPAAAETAVALLDPRFQRVIEHIEAHLSEDLTIEALAGIAALSPFHFAKAFKQATGLPPHKFVASRRVDRAKVLLKTTQLPIAEIAFRVGWENVSHFTQAFKGATGTTPGAWRAGA